MTTAERGASGTQRSVDRFFAEPLRDYVLQCLGRPVALLQAGSMAPLGELAIAELTQGGFEISVSVVDDDNPIARRALREAQSAYDAVITGDLRSAPIPQRTYDVVYCALLLERVHHVELVLDRLVSALKPGGLLLLRTGDRRSAAALLDRLLPGPVRRAVWSRHRYRNRFQCHGSMAFSSANVNVCMRSIPSACLDSVRCRWYGPSTETIALSLSANQRLVGPRRRG